MTGMVFSTRIGLDGDCGFLRDMGLGLHGLGHELDNRLRLRGKRSKLAPSIVQSILRTFAGRTVHFFVLRRRHQQSLGKSLRSALDDDVVKVRYRITMTGNGPLGLLFQPADFALGLGERLERRPACVNSGGFRGVEQRNELAINLDG